MAGRRTIEGCIPVRTCEYTLPSPAFPSSLWLVLCALTMLLVEPCLIVSLQQL
jgi:hypothetical protein